MKQARYLVLAISALVLLLAACNTTTETNSKLSIILAGTGTGTVTATPAGGTAKTFSANGSQDYVTGTKVTLKATADAGSTFTGWTGGGCSGTGDCLVTVDAAKTVTATFELDATNQTLTVDLAGTGSGTVSATPPTPAKVFTVDGSQDYATDTEVTLTATAAAGSTFIGWSGAGCSGTGTCVVTMDAAKTVTATFNTQVTPGKAAITVSTAGTGSGSVTMTPAGGTAEVCETDGSGTCTVEADPGTVVTLEATADAGSTFDAFSGEGCTTTPCDVTLGAADSSVIVTATFSVESSGNVTVTTPLGGSDDDAEEYVTGKSTGTPGAYGTPGAISTDTAFVELGYSDKHGSEQLVALRFPNVDIPVGSTIVSARIDVVAYDDSAGGNPTGLGNAGALPLLITAQDSVSPTAFTDTGNAAGPINQISGRSNTGTTVSWNAPDLTAWTAESTQATEDITTLIQDVIDLGGWNQASNAIVIMFKRDPADSSQSARHFYDLDSGNAANGAMLVVEYTPPAP